MTSEFIASLSGFRNLMVLNLHHNEHDDAVFANVKFAGTPISRSLESIQFSGGTGFNLVLFLSCISACTNLREICLTMGCCCDDACFNILAASFPLLEKIALNYIKEHVHGLKPFVAQSKKLKTVILMYPCPKYRYHTNGKVARAEIQSHLDDLRSFFPLINFTDYHFRQFK